MKTLIQVTVFFVAVWAIAVFHPFGLALPWQSGSPTPVTDSVLAIMEEHEFELETLEWGRATPFNFVAADGIFTTSGNISTTCTELRESLDAWGSVTAMERLATGCEIEALSRGRSMAAHVSIAETESLNRPIQIDIRVQHRR